SRNPGRGEHFAGLDALAAAVDGTDLIVIGRAVGQAGVAEAGAGDAGVEGGGSLTACARGAVDVVAGGAACGGPGQGGQGVGGGGWSSRWEPQPGAWRTLRWT